jgi:histidyl-tRNA synthetase
VKFEAPRGTHDVLPSQQPLWERIAREAEALCRTYGYARITTPVFEDTALFQRTSGAGSDVVQNEMYTFVDRSGRSLTLRPEATAPICRAYIEHGMHRDPQPVKLYTVASIYRYAAPQRGRYREHWQLSVEAIGSDDPALDAEVIQLYHELLRRLGLTEWELRINSIGDAACRPWYLERLNAWLDEHADALDEEARQKRATLTLLVLDVKNTLVLASLQDAPKIGDSLCGACREHFDAVRRYLDGYGVPYAVDSTLVRGLDYYTRTTFQYEGPEEGAQSTLCGGGRYDGLVEEIGGPPTPGIGFGTGIERLVLALEHENITAEAEPIEIFIAFEEEGRRAEVLPLIASLRREGRSCDADYAGRSLKGQLSYASRIGVPTVVIVQSDGFSVRRRGEQDRKAETLEELL